jgi:hypothetical protein
LHFRENFRENSHYFRHFLLRNFRENENKFSQKCEKRTFSFQHYRIGSAFDSFPNPDRDPEGLKRNKMNEKNAAKRQAIRHKKYKKSCIGITLVTCRVEMKQKFSYFREIFCKNFI